MNSTHPPDWIDVALGSHTAIRKALDEVKRELAERRQEAKYNPRWRDQPRAPRGARDGGQWTDGHGRAPSDNNESGNVGAPDGAFRTEVDLRLFDFFSPYVRRSNRYSAIQRRLNASGFEDTFYFAAVSKMTANLANMDNFAVGWLAFLSPEVRTYSNWLSQGIADFNEGQYARILSGAIRERGPALDLRLIADEQRFIQTKLDRLARQNPGLYRDFIIGINRNANISGPLDFINHRTDGEIAAAADRARQIIGGSIDFANEQHRNIMGQEMVRQLRR